MGLKNVQGWVAFPLLLHYFMPKDSTLGTAAAYKIIITYLFYTAMTPKDFLNIPLQSSVLPCGQRRLEEESDRSQGIILLVEYFCFFVIVSWPV